MSCALVDEVSTESSPRAASSLPEPVDESLFSNSSASVHEEGLEPPRLAAPEPKSGASANSATRARSLPGLGERRDSACGALRLPKVRSWLAAFGGGFAAVFRVFVGIAMAGAARDDAAGTAQTGGVRVGGAALDAAHAAVLGVVGEDSLAIIGRVAVAVGGAGRAILEASDGRGIGFWVWVWGFARAVCRNCHRHARGTATQTPRQTQELHHGQQSDAVLHPPLTRK